MECPQAPGQMGEQVIESNPGATVSALALTQQCTGRKAWYFLILLPSSFMKEPLFSHPASVGDGG